MHALRDDPETAEWCKEKGEAANRRGLLRIWDKAGEVEDEIDRVIAEFNAKFMVVNDAGKAVIYALAEDPILHRSYYDRLAVGDLTYLYMNRRIEVGVTKEGNPSCGQWRTCGCSHRDRRQFIDGSHVRPVGRSHTGRQAEPVAGVREIQPRASATGELMNAPHVRDVICGRR